MAYTYIIGWRALDRWYYGYRSVKRKAEDDLWKRYFTSSKLVKEYVKKYGNPDVIRVHKKFEEASDARRYEEKFLTKVDARHSIRWINQTNGNLLLTTKPGKVMSEEEKEHRRKMSTGLRAYHNEDGIVKKFRECPGEGWTKGYPKNHHGLVGFKHSEESKSRMGKPLGTIESEETRKKKSEAYFNSELKQQLLREVQQRLKGTTKSEEVKQRHRDAWVKRKENNAKSILFTYESDKRTKSKS